MGTAASPHKMICIVYAKLGGEGWGARGVSVLVYARIMCLDERIRVYKGAGERAVKQVP